MSEHQIDGFVHRLINAGCEPGVAASVVAQVYIAGFLSAADGRTDRRPKTAWELDQPCSVYVLEDPRDDNKVYYVGISHNPEARLRRHLKDRFSAAFTRLQELVAEGYEPIGALSIHAECTTRAEAMRIESELINTLPGLVNRAGYKQGAGNGAN